MEITLDDRQVLWKSKEAHNEIIELLGSYEQFKGFELTILNNPPGKGNMTKGKWVAVNEKRWKEVKAEKINQGILRRQADKPSRVTQLDNKFKICLNLVLSEISSYIPGSN